MNNEPPARMHFEGNEMGNYDFNWSGLNNVISYTYLGIEQYRYGEAYSRSDTP